QTDNAAASAETTSIQIERPPHLAIGNYVLQQQITNDQQEVISTQHYPVHVVAKMPKVYIDAQGFTVVNGERFFPLGIYTGNHGAPGDYRSNSGEKDLQRMADAGLNTVLSYSYAQNANAAGKEFLDLAATHHLQVIYSVK